MAEMGPAKHKIFIPSALKALEDDIWQPQRRFLARKKKKKYTSVQTRTKSNVTAASGIYFGV